MISTFLFRAKTVHRTLVRGCKAVFDLAILRAIFHKEASSKPHPGERLLEGGVRGCVVLPAYK
jgi:hypothetical protein